MNKKANKNKQTREKKETEKKFTGKISNKGMAQSTPFIGINIFITKQLSMKNPEVSIVL